MSIKKLLSFQLLLYGTLSFHQVASFVTTTTDLAGNATTAVLHKKSGTWVIGSGSGGAGQAILAYAGPASGSLTEELTSWGVTANINIFVSQLALSEQPSNSSNLRAIYVTTDNALNLHINSKGGTPTTVLAANILDANGQSNAGITSPAASGSHAFAAIAPHNGNWGDIHSGIGLFSITDDANNTLGYIGGNAIPNRATLADATTDQYKGSAAGANPTIGVPVLHWCHDLSTLYVGISGVTGANAGDAIKVLSAYQTNAPGTRLNAIPLVNNNHATTLLNGTNSANSNIIGCTNGGGGPINYSILKIDSMRTSTNHHYVILQGGLGTGGENPSRQIFALPVVDSDGDVPGALADISTVNGILHTNFKITARSNGNLLTEISPSAIVGNAQLPVAQAPNVISQMVVVGDAVYCSVNGTNGVDTDNGIYYSQAIFNTNGSIAGWTLWGKTVPNQTSGVDATNGACTSFGVDAITGKIWTTQGTKVKVSHWEKPTETTTLVGSVNALLEGPCYSQLHLNKSIMNFNDAGFRWTLFGGHNKVIYTIVEERLNGFNIETSTSDWTAANTQATNYSSGLENVGAINTLGWTNQDNTVVHNYFLAGTNNGLYAFARHTTGDGMSLEDDKNTLQNFSWQKIFALGDDPVVKIISMTGVTNPVTFVLTQGKTHKLWRLRANNNTNITTFNATATLVWETAPINNTNNEVAFFYDIALTMVTDAITSSTLVLATEKGLQIADDVTKPDARNISFSHLDLSNETHEIRSLSTPERTRLNQQVNYVRSMLRPVADGGWTPAATSALGSVYFTTNPQQQYSLGLRGDSIASGNNALPLPATIKNFYSDGARRFYIEQVAGDSMNSSTLHIVPYHIGQYDEYPTSKVFDLADGAIDSSRTFYWVNNIGAGYLCAGTDDGIIALQ